MICPRCGTQNIEEAMYCARCRYAMGQMLPQMNQMPPQMNPMPPQMNQMWPQMNQMPPQMYQTPPRKTGRNVLLALGITAGVVLLLLIIVGVVRMNQEKPSAKETSSYSNHTDYGYTNVPASTPLPTMQPVTQSPAEPEWTEPEVTATPMPVEDGSSHTIMVYMVGSDLESGEGDPRRGGAATRDIEEMMVGNCPEGTRIVLQTGGCTDWKREEIADNAVGRYEVRNSEIIPIETLGEINMLSSTTLAEFIIFAAETYPADAYTLVLWDHGGGIPVSFGVDEMFPLSDLEDYEIRDALAWAGVYFEGIVFDACHMSTLEVAMAVKDYADYLVGGESVLLGLGQDYTAWLNYLGTEGATISESYEVMAEAYMESVELYREEHPTSISVIDLGKIEEVYAAYAAYADSVYEDIMNGLYAEYVQARNVCGAFGYTESVDIITLAEKYYTEASAALIEATENAVCYSESHYAYGNGLAVYSPNEYITYYDSVRESMEEMEYSTEILDFNDAVVSIGLVAMGTDAVEEYAGEWFDIAAAYGEVEEDHEPQTYSLEIVETEDGYVIPISEEDWSQIAEVSVNLGIMDEDGNGAYMLGCDHVYEVDENGYIIFEEPSAWAYINDYFATYIALSSYSNPYEGQWTSTGFIYARLNGEDILIDVYYDNEHPEGIMTGYYYYDFETEEGDHTFYEFAPDDVVELVRMYITMEGEVQYLTLENAYFASDLDLIYSGIDYGDNQIIVWYKIEDIYGNDYLTPELYIQME